jgi:hypothetical protein
MNTIEPTTITRLRRLADMAAKFRGHRLKWDRLTPTLAEGICIDCGEWVQVNTRPLPNGFDIGGPAIARDCREIKS